MENLQLDTIYNIDCLEGMKMIPDGSVDLVVTSPPYNVGIDYGEEYNDSRPFPEYMAFIRNVLEQSFRVLKSGGRAVFNVANTGRKPYIPLNAYYNISAIYIGFKMLGEVVWHKGAAAGTGCAWGSWLSASAPSLRDEHEYLLCYCKDFYCRQEKGKSTLEREEFMDLTKSVWNFGTASARKEGHPVPFPLELPRRAIRLFSYEGDTILDPFMGSGTTAVASVKEKRHYIGFELSKEYYEKAVKRVKEFSCQTSLF